MGLDVVLTSTCEALWRYSNQGLVLIGLDGGCARVNATASRILGVSEGELLQTPPASWLPSAFSVSMGSAVQGTWEGLLAMGTGRAVPVAIDQTQVLDGDVPMVLLFLTDRSEVLSLEENLQHMRQQQLMGRLCGGVVHDLNNLLTVIVAALETSERDLEGREQPLRVSDGQEAVRRCESLCSQLLTMGQCEPGPVQLVEPDHVIGGMRRLLNRAKPDHVELALALNAPGRQVSLPAGALELIILNLLIGGSESLPKGAGVRLTTDSRALRYHLSLENNGPGIPEGQLRRMLEPRTSLPASGGLMGLTVLHNLVSRVGGQIDVKSVPGTGVVIDVSLEVTQAEPKTPPPPHAPFDATIRGDGKTILLCENDEVLRDVMAATLVEQGYGVVACADGARGLALIDSNADLDAVITDLVMPNAGGAEVALACNLRGRSTPVVFISGHLDRDALPELGAPNEFLAKPFRMNDLLAALQVVLANVSR